MALMAFCALCRLLNVTNAQPATHKTEKSTLIRGFKTRSTVVSYLIFCQRLQVRLEFGALLTLENPDTV